MYLKGNNMEQINLYKLVLDNWYWNRFNSISNYQKTIINLNSMSFVSFTKDLRTIEMNLSRGQGATTAIAEFIKEHQDLNITLIVDNMMLLKDMQSNLKDLSNEKLKIYTKKHLRGLCIENKTDIIFIDTAAYTYDDEVSMYLYNLNSDYNKNQWVVKFG